MQISNFLKYAQSKDRFVQWSTNKAEEMEIHCPMVACQTEETDFGGLLPQGINVYILPNTNFKIALQRLEKVRNLILSLKHCSKFSPMELNWQCLQSRIYMSVLYQISRDV